MPRDGSDEVADLWAMVAELERQFAAYKQRLAERNGSVHNDANAVAACDDDDDGASGGGGGEDEVEPCDGDDIGDVMRGRMYEAYVRRRDERLRQGWRARMERKEAEVMAFWAQIELSGRRAGGNSGGGRPTTTGAGDEAGITERNDQDNKKSSDAALAPRRISGKKHARTRSFSSSTNTSTNLPDDAVGRQRAQSQESPPSEPQVAADSGKESRRAWRAGGAAKTTTTATSRPKTSLRRKSSVKAQGSAKQTGPKLPRSPPRRASSSGLEDLRKEVVHPSADSTAPLPRRSYEQEDFHGEAPEEASPPRPSTSIIGVGDDDADKAQTASPSSDRSEVVDVVPESKHEAKNADMKKHRDEVDGASNYDKVGNPNGEITSDSDIETNCVYINKSIVKEQALSLPETRAAPTAVPDFSEKTIQGNSETTSPTGAAATGVVATNAEEEAPARESSGDSSSSGRSGRSPPSSANTSCSAQGDESIERVLEADAALLRKMREKQRTEKSAPKTPSSAGSRVSGTARSPKDTPKGFKRFLSFGKKNRAREVTVIDCTSPSVSSVADDDSGRWQSAGSIKPRLGSSDAAACPDCTDHARTTSPPRACSLLQSPVPASPAMSELAEIVPQGKSPKAHRSFFSFRSLNCGRG